MHRCIKYAFNIKSAKYWIWLETVFIQKVNLLFLNLPKDVVKTSISLYSSGNATCQKSFFKSQTLKKLHLAKFLITVEALRRGYNVFLIIYLRNRNSKAILNFGGSFLFVVLFSTRTTEQAHSVTVLSIRSADCNSSNHLSAYF